MYLPDFFHKLVEKFSPLEKAQSLKLNDEASRSYFESLQKAKEKKDWNDSEVKQKEQKPEYELQLRPMSLKDKVMLFSDLWYVRYGLAILFVILVPTITKWINGDGDDDQPENGMSELEQFMEFKRAQAIR